MSKTIVAQFKSVVDAQNAKHELVNEGYKAEDIRVVANEESSAAAGAYSTGSTSSAPHGAGVMDSIKHFFSSLTADENEHEHYAQGVSRGGALLSATVPDTSADAAIDLLEQCGASDFQDGTASAAYATPSQIPATSGTTDTVAIPIVEEELQVGKRQVNRGGVRVYSHVVETPVEETLKLREERVTVERSAVNRPASEADFQAFKEGSIELTETGEEAVVSKQARVVEEVIVGKEATERTQTVKDSVRHTEVDVEDLTPELAKKATTSGR